MDKILPSEGGEYIHLDTFWTIVEAGGSSHSEVAVQRSYSNQKQLHNTASMYNVPYLLD